MHRSFYFIRHGQTDWNAEGRYQGHSDVPLNATGRQQAEQAAQRFKNISIDHIVSSDLSRAHDTAAAIAAVFNKPVITDFGLRERSYGAMEGLTASEVEARGTAVRTTILQPDGYYLPVDGEHFDIMAERLRSSITRHLAELQGNVLFVSHRGVFRTLSHMLLATSANSENAVPYHFDFNGTWTLREI